MNTELTSLENFDKLRMNYYSRLQKEIPNFSLMGGVIKSFLDRIIKDGGFYLRMRTETLPKVISSGRIKGNMETGISTSGEGGKARVPSCAAMFGCDPEKMQPADYPKFGYLSADNHLQNLLVSEEMSTLYGGTVVKLKKENFMHRTTITIGDSLQLGRCYGLIPDRVDNVLPTCVYGLKHGSDFAYPKLPNAAVCWYYLATKIVSKTLTPENFFDMDALIGDPMPIFEFFELQYHGIIDITKDVERVDIFDYSEVVNTPEVAAAAGYFKSQGIPFSAHSTIDSVYHELHKKQ